MSSMPSAKRLARRSVRLVEQFGYTRHHAALQVVQIAQSAFAEVSEDGMTDTAWLLDIASEAWRIAGQSRPPTDSQEVHRHGRDQH